jgi:LCP family protein required for cell wall assembly
MDRKKRRLDRPAGDTPYLPLTEQAVEFVPGANEAEGHARLQRRHPAKPVNGSKRRIGRVFGLFLLLIVALLLIYVGYISTVVAKISTKPLDFSGLVADETGRTNILVLGIGDPGHAGQSLSDTIMVLSYDARLKRVAQISVPRDLRVPIPGYGSAKINQANADGGPALAEQTVSNILGIPLNYYVKTDFTGLKQIVDAVGGVDVNVNTRLYDPEYPCDDNQYKVCGLDIKPGLQHMDGTKALQYVRCRKGTCGNDFGRAARQQEVLALVRTKAVSWQVLLNPTHLIPIATALRDNLESDMGAVQLAEFGKDWQDAGKNQPVSLVLSTSPGGYLAPANASSDLLPRDGTFHQIQNAVQNIFSQ